MSKETTPAITLTIKQDLELLLEESTIAIILKGRDAEGTTKNLLCFTSNGKVIREDDAILEGLPFDANGCLLFSRRS